MSRASRASRSLTKCQGHPAEAVGTVQEQKMDEVMDDEKKKGQGHGRGDGRGRRLRLCFARPLGHFH